MSSGEQKTRCSWCGNDPVYVEYHDKEWGVPVLKDRDLFELLVLEGFQAGLSWITILRKRPHFRKVFNNFDAKKIAVYGAEDFERLMQDPGIIRNRLKIESSAKNARAFLEVQKEFGSFRKFIWRFTGSETLYSGGVSRTTSPESDAMSKELLRRGFKFVGSTICYAFMQAAGMVDDHAEGCWKYKAAGRRPTRTKA